MNRLQSLFSIGALVGAPAPAGLVSPSAGSNNGAGTALTDFRYVIPVGPYRVGVLAVGAVLVGELGSARTTVLNMPRPAVTDIGWQKAIPPAVPYLNPGSIVSDVITRAAPDAVSAAAAVGSHALFGIVPGTQVVLRSFLLRVTPSTEEMQTYVLPRNFDGRPIAFFIVDGLLTVIDSSGHSFRTDYP